MISCTAICREGGGRNYDRFLIAGVYILVVASCSWISEAC